MKTDDLKSLLQNGVTLASGIAGRLPAALLSSAFTARSRVDVPFKSTGDIRLWRHLHQAPSAVLHDVMKPYRFLNHLTDEVSFQLDTPLIADGGKKYHDSVRGLYVPLENPCQILERAVNNHQLVT